MNIFEITQPKATANTKIYLDMDGVLADFFAEYAKLAGVTTGNYRDIPPAKADPTLDKMVGTDFFSRLPKFPTADSLVKLVLKYVKSYNICSSPLRGDHKNSEQHKRIWIKNHLNPQPAEIIITGQKERHAVNADGSPNILIDDRGSNIANWRAKGGIGIKYQADEDNLNIVAAQLKNSYSKGKEDMRAKELEVQESELDSLVKQQDKISAKKSSAVKSSPAGNFMKGLDKTIKSAPNYISTSTSFYPGKK